MAKRKPKRATRLHRQTRIGLAVFLSAIYFVLAIGIWAGQQAKLGIRADLTGSCASQTVTDDFENFSAGFSGDFGWQVGSSLASAVVRSGIGNPGNALEIVTGGQGDAVPVQARDRTLAKEIAASASGSVSLDVFETIPNSSFDVQVRNATNTARLHASLFNGTFKAWQLTSAGKSFVALGNASYQANQWLHLELRWNTAGADLSVNGVKINPLTIPYDLALGTTSPGEMTTLVLLPGLENLARSQLFTPSATHMVDNIRYPGCPTFSPTTSAATTPTPTSLTTNSSTGLGTSPSTALTTSPATSETPTASSSTSLGASSSASPTISPTPLPTIVADTGPTTTPPATVSTSQPATTPTVASELTTSAPQSVSTAATTFHLVATGGALGFNLLIASLLSILTTYLFLRRRENKED